jgi:DNA-binding Lrp family transcriptional regulator
LLCILTSARLAINFDEQILASQMTSISAPLAKLADIASQSTPEVGVDDVDLALLSALALDARQSRRGLARQLEVSPSVVADRLARLERSGVIRGYRVEVDWAALGYPVVVYVAVTVGPGVDLSEVITAIRALPETGDLSVVTGPHDLLVRLRLRDHAHLRELLLGGVFQVEGVQRTETFLSLADLDASNVTAGMLQLMRERNIRR